MDECVHMDGWRAQTEYAAEYAHRGCRWALNFFVIDDEDAKKKLESIRSSSELLGPVLVRIPME